MKSLQPTLYFQNTGQDIVTLAVFSLYRKLIINFIILVILLLLPWLFFLIFYALWHGFGVSTAGFDINGDLSLVILGLGLLTYLSVASHKLYRANWWLRVAKSFAVLIGLFFCVLFYRFVLFMATMAML